MQKLTKTEPKPVKPAEAEPAVVEPVKPAKPAVRLHPNGLPYRNYPGDGSDTRRGMNIPMD